MTVIGRGYEATMAGGILTFRRLRDGAIGLDRDDGMVLWCRRICSGFVPLYAADPDDGMYALLDRLAGLK